MSTVDIWITRKKDAAPIGRYYLGGDKVRKDIPETFEWEYLDNMIISPLTSSSLLFFLSFCDSHFAMDSDQWKLWDDLDKYPEEEYSYFLVVE